MKSKAPGLATVSEIARHWALSRETTQKLLDVGNIAPVESGPRRYDWRDVWCLEGAAYVPSEEMSAFKKPLLKPAEAQAEYLRKLRTRTISDQAKKGKLPGIKLGTEWRFRERDVKRLEGSANA
ncbi:helix-turn-helix domain-containing protein [Pseudooceanicola sp.]|uniref:helix-turn-helix domain-containing protein n=1 Tax=Pseudooceanicola sp. TaxID=1914328 RepID=UPI003514A973